MSRKLPVSLQSRVVKLNVDAEMPFMRRGQPATQFKLLRDEVQRRVGYDFLQRVELLRLRGFISQKPGIKDRSRHICGDSFDFDRNDERFVLVGEPEKEKQFWRVFIRSQYAHGRPFDVRGKLECDVRGKVEGHFVDFTKLAGKFGFVRVPAWSGWSHRGAGALLREFWHYQLADDLTWNEATTFLYGRHSELRPLRFAFNDRTFGLNDRGKAVGSLQIHLATLTLLPVDEVDGVFGARTCDAVKAYQRQRRLSVTGLAEPETRRQLAQDVIRFLAPPQTAR